MKTGLVLLLALAAATAHAQPAVRIDPHDAALAARAESAHRAYTARLASALAATGEARSLAYAALLREAGLTMADAGEAIADPQAREWRALAFQRAGTDLVALALLATGSVTGDPVAGQAIARWQQLQPDNAAPWMYAGTLDASQLPQLATVRRADFLLHQQLRWLVAAHRQHPPTPPEAALLHAGRDGFPRSLEGYVIAYSVGLLVPNPMSLGSGSAGSQCRKVAATDGSVQADACRALASALSSADNRLMETVGVDLALRLAADGASRRRAADARRRIDWQIEAQGRAAAAQADHGEAASVRAILDPAMSSEREVVEHQLREAGIPLEPPPGWQPRFR